jgi:hypothetical protein
MSLLQHIRLPLITLLQSIIDYLHTLPIAQPLPDLESLTLTKCKHCARPSNPCIFCTTNHCEYHRTRHCQ